MSKALTGAVVDCGSGHTSITFYGQSGGDAPEELVQRGKTWLKHADGGNLPLTDVVPGTQGGGLSGGTLAERVHDFIGALSRALERPLIEGGERERPAILLIGGTGGVRAALDDGTLTDRDVVAMRTAFSAAFGSLDLGFILTIAHVLLSGMPPPPPDGSPAFAHVRRMLVGACDLL